MTHRSFFASPQKPTSAILIRHDVDHDLEKALIMAKVEAEIGIKSSYFLLPPGDYDNDTNYYGRIFGRQIIHDSRLIDVAAEIQSLGHEIGLHNDFLQLSLLLERPIEQVLRAEVEYFCENGIEITGTASHGSRFARAHGFINYEIFIEHGVTSARPWKSIELPGRRRGFTLPCISMRNLGLEYEAYEVRSDFRLSDVGGRLTCSIRGFEAISVDFVNGRLAGASEPAAPALDPAPGIGVALVHPEHWVPFDSGAKKFIAGATSVAVPRSRIMELGEAEHPRFVRRDGKPVRIAVRGDCVCRRGISLNPHLFPNGYEMVVNEKATNRQFCETISGTSPSLQRVREYVDVDSMVGSLRKYFEFQFDRSVLDMQDVDLIVIDTYSDMNFQMWRHNSENWSIWIHPKFTNMDALRRDFTQDGFISLDESKEYIGSIISYLRNKNPDTPVLCLYQPIEYYRKLDDRRNFYDLPGKLSAEHANVYSCGILEPGELGPADMGSCGPGQTLHFDGATYEKMIREAWDNGLSRHFSDIQPTVPEYDGSRVPLPAELSAFEPANAPYSAICYGDQRPNCINSCSSVPDAAVNSFAQYIIHPESGDKITEQKRFTPMTIDVSDGFSLDTFEAYVKSFGNGAQIRQARKAQKNGYYCKPFAMKLHIPDMHEINHSKESRSGGKMRGSYTRTIDEMGGAPDSYQAVVMPKCEDHWALMFGTFKEAPSHMQGSVEVGEKLFAYISLRRMGDVALYSQILGHGEHLSDGILILLHLEVMRWIDQHRSDVTRGLRFVMYGGAQNGGQSLYRWKRQAGFLPRQLIGFASDRKLHAWMRTLQA